MFFAGVAWLHPFGSLPFQMKATNSLVSVLMILLGGAQYLARNHALAQTIVYITNTRSRMHSVSLSQSLMCDTIAFAIPSHSDW